MLFSYEKWRAEWIIGCKLAESKISSSQIHHHTEKNKKKQLVEPLIRDPESQEDH